MFWLLVPVVAGLAGYIWYEKTHPDAAVKKDAVPPTNAGPPLIPGTGTVDGHGTGVVITNAAPGVNPNVIDGHGTGLLEPDPIAAAAAAAQIAAQQNPATIVDQATLAAETVKLQTIDALNTPEGDRTPEQLALLSGLASLPVLNSNAR